MGALFAVTPLVLAPVVVLAMLFPALFAGPLAFLRRWWLFLNVCTLSLTIYTVCVLFTGVRRQFWWAKEAPMWSAITCLAVAGALWAWRRPRKLLAKDLAAGVRLRTGEKIVLCLVGVLGLRVVMYCLFDGRPFLQPLLVVWAAGWAGALYAILLWRVQRPRLPVQGVMFAAMAVPCAALAFTSMSYDRSVIWTFSADDRGVIQWVLVADGRVYAGASLHGAEPWGALYCIDPANGKPRWCFTDNRQIQVISSVPCLANGRLYFTARNSSLAGKLYCLDAVSGQKVWEYFQPGAQSSVLRAWDGKVFLLDDSGKDLCFDAATGVTQGQSRALAEPASETPALVGRRYCVVTDSGKLCCFDSTTGATGGELDLPRLARAKPHSFTSPVVVDGRIYIGTSMDYLITGRAATLYCLKEESLLGESQ